MSNRSDPTPIPVLQIITRFIVGGAQETVMLMADHLNNQPEFDSTYRVDVVSGPQTGAEGSLQEEIRRRGVQLTIVPELLREISPVNDIKAIFKLRRLIQDGNYQIVHTHSSKAGVLGRIAARLAGVPHIVHTVHGWSFHDQMSTNRRRIYVWLEKIGRLWGKHVIVVSTPDIQKGIDEGLGHPEEYHLIRSGVELNRFGHPSVSAGEMKAKLGIPLDAFVVGSVTRLSLQKAPLDLIKAWGAVGRQYPNVWFLIVGDGPLRPEVEAKAAALGISERLVLTGLRRDVPELLNCFDCFVISSKWEGLPRVLPQAMAAGVPIVATDADGTREAIKDQHNGFLVPRGRSDLIAERIEQLIEDENLRDRFVEIGQREAVLFGDLKMVRDIDRFYQEIIGSNN
ncbi:MAG: glycosyltransferase family 4 protein [Chloroflexota bacterium]